MILEGGGTTGGGSCTDKKAESCAGWKNAGYCNGQYANYMKDNCKKSCGYCWS